MDEMKLNRRTGFIIEFSDVEFIERYLSYEEIGMIIIGLRDFNINLSDGSGEDIQFNNLTDTAQMIFDKMKRHAVERMESYLDKCKKRVNKRYLNPKEDNEPPNLKDVLPSPNQTEDNRARIDKTRIDKTIVGGDNNIGGAGGKEEDASIITHTLLFQGQQISLYPIRPISKYDNHKIVVFLKLMENATERMKKGSPEIVRDFIRDMMAECKNPTRDNLRKFYRFTGRDARKNRHNLLQEFSIYRRKYNIDSDTNQLLN